MRTVRTPCVRILLPSLLPRTLTINHGRILHIFARCVHTNPCVVPCTATGAFPHLSRVDVCCCQCTQVCAVVCIAGREHARHAVCVRLISVQGCSFSAFPYFFVLVQKSWTLAASLGSATNSLTLAAACHKPPCLVCSLAWSGKQQAHCVGVSNNGVGMVADVGRFLCCHHPYTHPSKARLRRLSVDATACETPQTPPAISWNRSCRLV